ncbi:MAG: hypothetical protein IKD53_00055, partial [Clostridia bacterium]|nr:hypothetical protein [Clostridia bacterium]
FHILRGIEQYLSRESVYQLQEQFKKESLGIGDSIEVHIYSAPLDESTIYEDLLDRGCMPRSLPMHKTEYDRIIREGMGVATRDIDYLEMDHICSRESSGLWYYKASEITESNGSFFIGQHELIIFLDNAKILIYAKVVI